MVLEPEGINLNNTADVAVCNHNFRQDLGYFFWKDCQNESSLWDALLNHSHGVPPRVGIVEPGHKVALERVWGPFLSRIPLHVSLEMSDFKYNLKINVSSHEKTQGRKQRLQ